MVSKMILRKQRKESKGITLIALVITIIVLLILAAVSIATLTGENGVLTKASKAEKETDITETKEQIKLELMGNFNEEKVNYTNGDVIIAVKKITNQDVTKNQEIVKSIKGNDVNIKDLWVEEQPKCYFLWHDLDVKEHKEEIFFQKGDTWNSSEMASDSLGIAVEKFAEARNMSGFHLQANRYGEVQTLFLYEGAMSDPTRAYIFKLNGNVVDINSEIVTDAIYYFE